MSEEPKKLTIDELEELLDSGKPFHLLADGRVVMGADPDEIKAALVADNERLTKALHALTQSAIKHKQTHVDWLVPPRMAPGPSIYERPPGTDQCLETIEVREVCKEKGTAGHPCPGTVTHWACCFRERHHPGQHRHWIPVDWKDGDETLTLRHGRKARKDKRR